METSKREQESRKNMIKYVFLLCSFFLLSLTGCGKQTPSEENASLTSIMTEEPEQTKPSAGTPIATEEPEKTDIPAMIEIEDGIEENLPEGSEYKSEYTYHFYEMVCVAETEHIYEVDRDGVYRLNFTEQYNQVIFALPEGINMALCDYVTVKAKSEYGHLAVKLYDENAYIDPWAPEVYVRYDCIGEGVCEFTLEPELICDVWGVGLMSSDKVEDFSQYKAEAYSVTFHMRTGE